MRIFDVCKIDNKEDSKTVESFISQNYKSLITKIKNKIEIMTEHKVKDEDGEKIISEQSNFLNLRVAPYKDIFIVVLLYKPDYLFSEARKADITKFRKWLEGELLTPMKIIQETTQSSSIPTPAAKHVHLQPPPEMQKMKAPIPTQPGKIKQKPLITFEKKE